MTLQDLVVSILGGTLMLSGFAIRYWTGKRRFYRRGPGGLQHYSSYSKALIISTIERIANFLSIPVILGGIFLLVFWWMFARGIVLSRNEVGVKNNAGYKTEPTAHFLVPAEHGFATKKICPIPKIHSPFTNESFAGKEGQRFCFIMDSESICIHCPISTSPSKGL